MKSDEMRILGIETSCDETSLAIVEAEGGLRAPKFTVLAHELASQIKIHRPYGGVVPMLAKREHTKNLPILYRKIFGSSRSANRLWKKIDAIAVTVGPGLEPALWAGIEFAKALAQEQKKPLVGANHLEGHLYSFLLPKKTANPKSKTLNSKSLEFRNSSLVFPAISLLVSGGHTILLCVESLAKWRKLGETRDDAVGEAFDKVARLLGLPYPGGPQLEKLALSLPKGETPSINFPRPMARSRDYNFSFSGLKTSVFYFLRDNPKAANSKSPASPSQQRGEQMANIAASFQKAAIEVLTVKTVEAARMFRAKSIILSGGVAANQLLRSELKARSKKFGLKFLVSDPEYNTDNAVMIAAAGYMSMLRRKKYRLIAQGNLNI